MLDKLKIQLTKNNNKLVKNAKKKIKQSNKILDIDYIINNIKINQINKSNKTKLTKTKKVKINIYNDNESKIKSERRICINLEVPEIKKSNENVNEKKTIIENKAQNISSSESSKIIKESISLMEKEINAFKEHNLFIKQQLEKMFNNKK